jgi:chemotaxis protein MotB
MMRRRKKKRHEEHVDESWLLPYSDLLTLLLALFIVLFASSSIDAQKFEAMSKVFSEVFHGGTGVMQHQSPVEEGETFQEETKEVTEDDKEESTHAVAYKKDQEELKAIQERVNNYIEENSLEGQFATKLTSEGLLLTIRDNILFPSGSATVDRKDERIAEELSRLLEMKPPRNIIISGHTDNVPIGNANFESNWELSVMRAVNFMKLLLDNPDLDPEWFSAKGFGEFEPTASNDTAEGRAKNRRVEVLILPRVQPE